MRVTALIADDEPVARAGLRAMLGAFAWVQCIGEAASGPATVEAIDRLRPELLFLDVQMPGLLGTDVLRSIEKPPYVIFTTAYSEHAVTAFELGAVDYLLKPFGPRRLAAAMERVRAGVGAPAVADSVERVADALGDAPISRLFVRVGASLVPISVERISHLEADGDYVVIHVDGARHMLHIALTALEARLDTKRFMRVHRAHIVNLDQVKSFKRDARGNLEAVLANGTRVPVSRSRAQQLRGLVRG